MLFADDSTLRSGLKRVQAELAALGAGACLPKVSADHDLRWCGLERSALERVGTGLSLPTGQAGLCRLRARPGWRRARRQYRRGASDRVVVALLEGEIFKMARLPAACLSGRQGRQVWAGEERT